MSLTDFILPVSSQTDGADEYDHAIVLVDATKPAKKDSGPSSDDGTASVSRAGTGTQLGKRWTRGTLREELVRRKYAKWQEDRIENPDEPSGTTDDGKRPMVEGSSSDQSGTSKKGHPRGDRLRNKNPFKKRRGSTRERKTEDIGIDILYENQRGWFFCGIPLYSGRSLLPIDPSSWQTATFKYSPVNITNAQLPDPSWAWVWKTWYVDMSYDVDEEGWQYSFNFGQWAWHGTHPWFHSFVRRRRWLRKRVKLYPSRAFGDAGNLKQAHMLNEDYFTIHATRDQSRESSPDRTTYRQSSFASNAISDSENEEELGEVSDIPKLMGALKRARVDREVLWAVITFVDQGGDELFYLADRVDEIMNRFIYRTSRRQLQSFLLQEYTKAKTQKQYDGEDQRDEDKELSKKTSSLHKVIQVVNAYMEDNSSSKLNASKAENNVEDTEDGAGPEADAWFADREESKKPNDEGINRGSVTTKDEDDDNGIRASEEPELRLDSTSVQQQDQDQDRRPGQDQGQDQDRDPGQDQAQEQAQNQTRDQTRDPAPDQAQNHSRNQAPDQAQDQAQNQAHEQDQEQDQEHDPHQDQESPLNSDDGPPTSNKGKQKA